MPTPHPLTPRLTPADAIAVAKRGRKLLRAGRITHRQYVILDCLLWSCRNPATGAIVASYTALQKLCHVSRATIAGALAVLGRFGVLTKIKRRIRLTWHQGGTASRQLTSTYVLHPGTDTEFTGRPVIQIAIEKEAARGDGSRAVMPILAAQRAASEARVRAAWLGRAG